MEIIKATEGLSKKEIYDMTHGKDMQKMSDNEGVIIDVDKFVIYADANKDGEPVEILSIMDSKGDVYATNSPTAMNEFDFIRTLMGDDPFSVVVVKGTSKNGRTYTTLAMP